VVQPGIDIPVYRRNGSDFPYAEAREPESNLEAFEFILHASN
jgi:hypothetical protein